MEKAWDLAVRFLVCGLLAVLSVGVIHFAQVIRPAGHGPGGAYDGRIPADLRRAPTTGAQAAASRDLVASGLPGFAAGEAFRRGQLRWVWRTLPGSTRHVRGPVRPVAATEAAS